MVRPDGCVIDLHPTETLASVEVGTRSVGTVDAGDAPRRHAAADAALLTVLDAGLFTVERSVDFMFCTYADSIEELRDYVAATWRSTRIDEGVVQRVRDALHRAPASRPRVREHLRLTRLRPAGPS
jgi:hypothetical protein